MSNPDTPDTSLIVQWIFGTAVVLLYAWDRFRSPAPPRAMTTFWRYWSAACGYISAMMGLFVFLGGGIISFDLRILSPLIGNIPKAVSAPPGPLLSALVLTALLPNLPLLARIDEAIKNWFWNVGNIPIEVRMLGAQLSSTPFHHVAISKENENGSSAFRAYGVDLRWFDESDSSLKFKWAQCVALFGQLEQWENRRGYANYLEQNRSRLAELRSHLNSLSQWLNEKTLSELDGVNGFETVLHLRKHVSKDIELLWQSLCGFAAGGVLSETWSETQRYAELRKIGFNFSQNQRSPLSSHDIVLVIGFVFLVMLFVPLAMRRFFYPEQLPLNLRVLILVPIVYAIGVVLAIYPKSIWSYARRIGKGPRPVAAYALSGAVATGAAFVVSVLFRFAFDSPGNIFQALSVPSAFAKAWATTVERWPWLLMTFFTTVAIAWAADDFNGLESDAPRWARWVEAGSLALVFGSAQWLVGHLLISNASPSSLMDWNAALPRMMAASVVIGACIGFLIPSLYRERTSKNRTAAFDPQLV
ncbi:MAG: hypothetical protein QM766_07205 [Burkholderiaceae bacterium]